MKDGNADILRRWFDEALLGNKPDLVDELFADSIIVHKKCDEVIEQTKEDTSTTISIASRADASSRSGTATSECPGGRLHYDLKCLGSSHFRSIPYKGCSIDRTGWRGCSSVRI